MKLVEIYKGLGDETRLRILNLLAASPLCVCHFQGILGRSQVVISQHLAYLRERKLVSARRYRHWMIYSLPEKFPLGLKANLECLKEAREVEPTLRRDGAKLEQLMGGRDLQTFLDQGCCTADVPAGEGAAQ